jgi:hypothetical protein
MMILNTVKVAYGVSLFREFNVGNTSQLAVRL